MRSHARDWGLDQEAKLRRGAYPNPGAGKIKFAEWCDRWWEARLVEPHTQRGDASCIRTHITPYWSDREVRAISRLDVQSWVRKLVVAGKGPSAVRRAYNLLSSIMRAAVDEDLITVTPCRRIDLPPEAVKPPQWFTVEQAQAILDELDQPWQTMVLLAFYTGLRWGELAGLHGHRIDAAACLWWKSTRSRALRNTRKARRAAERYRFPITYSTRLLVTCMGATVTASSSAP
ncbi:tyrosine recombinase XerC [Streptomyces sp. NPDC059835]|uniref:site-specific integrase n=1 Tax=Streptomyces sp. NPDC059835 TaxID=3346967 RepID=UPI0036662B18